ncbi:hypothetical protein D3C87_1564040 [compost metagenome]
MRQITASDDRSRIASKQHRQIVFLLRHLGLELRYRSLGALEFGEVLRQFHFGNGAGAKAQFENSVGVATGLGGGAGDFQLPVKIAKCDVAGCHRGHQAQNDRTPTFLRGQQVSTRRLIEPS